MKKIKEETSIYDLAYKIKKHNPTWSNQKCIDSVLFNLLEKNTPETIIELIGINPYLDYLNLRENSDDHGSISKQIDISKIREMHFPISGLESTIIANTLNY